ncbi:hypothetical protein ANCCAN_13378 [Ancylostoma caninum]|uniref:SCP domain-containing protein n=1 Tax=Ancylostoma caninum TaxID=29170 RepID=A0A368GCE6_ANCCA|nr:hypothetical protein ANCCAN_13378 [Ancylostoma caninum]
MAYKGLQKIISSCDIPDTSITSPYQSIAVRFEKKNCNITSQAKVALYAWWSLIKYVVVNYPNNANGSPSVPAAPQFIRMATGNTTAFACTYDFCDSMPKGIMACIFNDIKLLASGWAKDPKAKSGYAPPGKQMKKLEYACSNTGGANIAEATYKAIEQCPATDPTSTAGYSMNFLRIKNYKLSQQDALKQAIEKWWGELGEKGLGDDTTFHDNSGIKSFANMAYDQADKFACAVQNCQQSGETLVACQYSPVIADGNKIYETGKVCSGCKKLNPARKCSNPAGLCE